MTTTNEQINLLEDKISSKNFTLKTYYFLLICTVLGSQLFTQDGSWGYVGAMLGCVFNGVVLILGIRKEIEEIKILQIEKANLSYECAKTKKTV
jgi:hypothetical protein